MPFPEDDLILLQRCFLFKDAKVKTLTEATQRAELRTFARNAVIYEKGAAAHDMGFLLEGRVEVSKEIPTGGRFMMNTLLPGSVFGVAGLFQAEQNHISRMTALETTRVAFFSQELLMDLMREDFSVAENYIGFLTNRIRFLHSKIGGLLLGGSETSLRHWLSRNMKQDGDACYVQVESMTKLASMLHMSRSSLYRAFDELEEAGLIRKEGKRIHIFDPVEFSIIDE